MRQRWYRAFLAVSTVVLVVALVGTNLTAAEREPYEPFEDRAARPAASQSPVAPERSRVTVVTSHRAGDIVAVNPNGTVLYHDGTHDGYWDVDPSPRGDRTVVYTATDEVRNESRCRPALGERYCIRQSIERANLTTGEVTTLYSRIDPRYHASEWHDADRVNRTRFLVADMYSDEVFLVDVSTGVVVWEWSVQQYAPLASGGDFPADWVHVNDVEALADGRFLVSLRNHDQVIFLHRNGTVDEEWTLGADGNHDVLYEQHNPDYIPASRGGPALLVAGSENNRIVEYQRTESGEWERTWTWRDDELRWPRDADRLPNGNTLISDTHGGRVVEVSPDGTVVWRFDVPGPYEAERLGTGEESAGGPSATAAGLQSRTNAATGSSEAPTGPIGRAKTAVVGLFPTKVVNGAMSVLPVWVGFGDVALFTGLCLVVVTWTALEIRWSSLGLRNPLVREE
jgi:hypothetical protein